MTTARIAKTAVTALLTLASPAAAQAPLGAAGPAVPNGQNLLEWSGWEVGETITFQDARGERHCVRVGGPREIQNRVWVPLQGLPWPTFASDSQILLAHDGTLELGVVRTPGPRPFVEPLHLPAPATLRFLEGVTPDQARSMDLEDGWYAFGNSAGAPTTLVYLWCARCADAGAVVRFERGRGLSMIKETTIQGTEKVHLVDDACGVPDIEFELYVEPAPGREP